MHRVLKIESFVNISIFEFAVLESAFLALVASLNEDKVKSRFYLVVDAEAMGIDILLQELIFRSKSSLPTGDEKIDALIGEVLPNLKDGVDNPEHYKEIDIWFSELFDTYLSSYGIQDIRRMVE